PGHTLSLDKNINDDSQQSFIDIIHDTEKSNPSEQIAFKDWCGEIRRLLKVLSPIEADVVRYRYGIENEDELTLKEIGEKYNLSRERIRQIQKAAIEKMRLSVKGLF
ncbi:MAG: sigma factor-like helix-turn-helix DNA-binding protein, partial [Pseudomonadota bacterium]